MLPLPSCLSLLSGFPRYAFSAICLYIVNQFSCSCCSTDLSGLELIGGVFSRWILKQPINTSLTHWPLVIDTQPVVTFGPLIIVNKSLRHISPSVCVQRFFSDVINKRRKIEERSCVLVFYLYF